MDAQGKWQFYLGRAKKHRNLNLQVIAEEVETAKQLAFLKTHGCRTFQGGVQCAIVCDRV
jgi:c-di-GMP-related signal transduction protein